MAAAAAGGLIQAIMAMMGGSGGGGGAAGGMSGAGGLMETMGGMANSPAGQRAGNVSAARRTSAEGLASLDSKVGAGAGLHQYQDVGQYGAQPYNMNSMLSELRQLSNAGQQIQKPPMEMEGLDIQSILGKLLGG